MLTSEFHNQIDVFLGAISLKQHSACKLILFVDPQTERAVLKLEAEGDKNLDDLEVVGDVSIALFEAYIQMFQQLQISQVVDLLKDETIEAIAEVMIGVGKKYFPGAHWDGDVCYAIIE